MRYKLNLLFSILIFFTAKTMDAQDDWMSYISEKNKGFMALTVNLRYDIVKPNYKNLVLVGRNTNNCHKNGYPNEQGLQELFTFSDTIAQVLNRTVKNRLVGVLTYQCTGFDVFYVKDTTNVRTALQTVIDRDFDIGRDYIFISRDKRWKYFKENLFPKNLSEDFFINQELLTGLFYDGYDLNETYNLMHWFYFRKEKQRDKFVDKIKVINVKIDSLNTIKDSKFPYEVQLSRKDTLQPAFIDELTRTFSIIADNYGGYYDGWGIKEE